jgi:hypothetical protein
MPIEVSQKATLATSERLEASGYDIPASEVQAGLELNLPCLVVTGQGSSGYKIIEEFLPEAAA